MKNLNPKRYAVALFLVFTFCCALVMLKDGFRVTNIQTAFAVGYKAIPLVLLVAGFFVSCAWKWKIFADWFVPFPNLNGTWNGQIQTTWKNPETGEIPGPIPVILTIKQSFVRISCVMRTQEMESRSFVADFWIEDHDQVRKLAYCYTSKPNASVVHRSAPHDGTIVFDLKGSPVTELHGQYWTSRKTTGTIHLKFYSEKLLDSLPPELGQHPLSIADQLTSPPAAQ